jgi:hypothetical protein
MVRDAVVDVPDVLVVGGVGSHPPIRRLAAKAGAMTVVRGSGLLSQVIERGREAVSCSDASSPGVWDRPWRWSAAVIRPPGRVGAGAENPIHGL